MTPTVQNRAQVIVITLWRGQNLARSLAFELKTGAFLQAYNVRSPFVTEGCKLSIKLLLKQLALFRGQLEKLGTANVPVGNGKIRHFKIPLYLGFWLTDPRT